MKRKKASGLAFGLVIALALSVGAGSAAASGFQASGAGSATYPAVAYSSTEVGDNSIRVGSVGIAHCGGGLILGTLNGDAKNMTASVGCDGGKVNMNGCRVSVNPGEETSKGAYSATLDIGGPYCKELKVETSSPKCFATVPAQSGLGDGQGGLALTNVSGSPDKVTLSGEAAMEAIGGGGPGTDCAKSGVKTTAHWEIDWTFTAQNAPLEGGSEALDLQVVSNPATGLTLNGGKFESESGSSAIAGEQDSPLIFTAAPGFASISCGSAEFTSVLSSAAAQLVLAPTFGNCSDTFGRAVVVDSNSCDLVLDGAGKAGVSCSSPGDYIEYQVKNGGGTTVCTVQVAAQTRSTASYTNSGSGSNATVEADLELGSVTSTTAGGFLNCGVKNGAQSQGTFSGGITLEGGIQPW